MQHVAANLNWRTSKSCTGGNCVQVAVMGSSVAVRDSKNPDGAILLYSASEWQEFLVGAKNGEFDNLD